MSQASKNFKYIISPKVFQLNQGVPQFRKKYDFQD